MVLLGVMVGEAVAEFSPDLSPPAGINVVSGGQLHLLAGLGVLIALLGRLELSTRNAQVHLCAEKER